MGDLPHSYHFYETKFNIIKLGDENDSDCFVESVSVLRDNSFRMLSSIGYQTIEKNQPRELL